MMPEAALTSLIATLFSMMNPIGNVGIFAGMTADRSAREARTTAIVCAVASAVTLLIGGISCYRKSGYPVSRPSAWCSTVTQAMTKTTIARTPEVRKTT